MEAITRLVADSLARHGLDRSVDPRRLQWSHWFRCDSPRSLLVVPSKAGIFALAEEVAALCGASEPRSRNPERSEGSPAAGSGLAKALLGGAALKRHASPSLSDAAPAAEGTATKRMLAVLQFSEDDDMAFTLDRMFTRINPMRSRLASGRCFLRFVVIQDREQRRSICTALNQWLLASAEKATGIGADFSSSLELNMDDVGTDSQASRATDHVARTLSSANSQAVTPPAQAVPSAAKTTFANAVPEPNVQHLDSGAASSLHCPHSLPAGF